jgi:hypothetical protein
MNWICFGLERPLDLSARETGMRFMLTTLVKKTGLEARN